MQVLILVTLIFQNCEELFHAVPLHGGDVPDYLEAARLLNIGLTTLYRKIEEYRINEFYRNLPDS
jgi:DNA-binding NtrC family response regulator